MRWSAALWKTSSSSTRWLARQANDPHTKARNVIQGDGPAYRSRSSFKLLSIHNKYPWLLAPKTEYDGDKIIVDLGAAPGGWSQAAAHKLGGRGRVFALDILDTSPISGVHTIKGDFLSSSVQEQLRQALADFRPNQYGLSGGYDSKTPEDQREGVVDVVLSDMMAPMTGVRLTDIRNSLDLVEAASLFAFRTLRSGYGEKEWLDKGRTRYPGGNLLLKFFQHPDLDGFKQDVLVPRFHKISVEKPVESRKESSEAYWLCHGYKGEPQ